MKESRDGEDPLLQGANAACATSASENLIVGTRPASFSLMDGHQGKHALFISFCICMIYAWIW
jgi:hypothetical protein